MHGTVVVLNVYDLSPANESCLYSLGLGVHHSGVEILGQEYSFASGAGIFDSTPKQVRSYDFSFCAVCTVFSNLFRCILYPHSYGIIISARAHCILSFSKIDANNSCRFQTQNFVNP